MNKNIAAVMLLLISTLGAGVSKHTEMLRALDNNPALARSYFDFAASQERIGVVEGNYDPLSTFLQ